MNRSIMNPADQAHHILSAMPAQGLFAEQEWRISPAPFALDPAIGREINSMGRILLKFYQSANLLYRQSCAGKQPAWIADYLDKGKPQEIIHLQRDTLFKNDIPRVIRPDVLLTESGLVITELDSVPGGIGVTAWLQKTYASILGSNESGQIIGGPSGMVHGFSSIFQGHSRVVIVVSDEAASYRPEMEYLSRELQCNANAMQMQEAPLQMQCNKNQSFLVVDGHFTGFHEGDAVYRFFELFDVDQVPNSRQIFDLARHGHLTLTPPPKTFLEEKMLFALFWNRNLYEFWRVELGEAFLRKLQQWLPYTWIIDPSPLPPQAGIPELPITDWRQLKTFSQKDRNLIIKISGYSEKAWGARGVYLGNDLSQKDWGQVVDMAIHEYEKSPHIIQRFSKPKLVDASWYDFEKEQVIPFKGRTRLCPYFFVSGQRENARANLGGVLATVCPDNKKIVHGMSEAILTPCAI